MLSLIRHTSLDKAHLRLSDISPILDMLNNKYRLNSEILGTSFEQRPIHRLTLGHGPVSILMWTQMHGDEATASASVLDLVDILCTESILPDKWQSMISIHIIPMLNPDGAEQMTRVNAQNIDMNRDALALQTPEGRILMEQVKILKPDYAFNLHDQSPYYQCGNSKNPSTIAFLAPAFDSQKTISPERARAMRLIDVMRHELEQTIPGKIARYDDTYSARSFGDQIAASGASTILIESGAHADDPNRQIARKLNTQALLLALSMICEQDPCLSLSKVETGNYFAIPENQSEKLCSLLINQLSFDNGAYVSDVAISQTARYSNSFVVSGLGDQHVMGGLSEFDATGMQYSPGRGFVLEQALTIDRPSLITLFQQGYSHFTGDKSLLNNPEQLAVALNPTQAHNERRMVLQSEVFGFLSSANGQYALLGAEVIAI